MGSSAEVLPGQFKYIWFGLCSCGGLSVSLRSWGATSCALFSLYLWKCSLEVYSSSTPAGVLISVKGEESCLWFTLAQLISTLPPEEHNPLRHQRCTKCVYAPSLPACQQCKCTGHITEEGACWVC